MRLRHRFSGLVSQTFTPYRPSIWQTRGLLTEHSPKHDPLRILFCGADEFSITSLRALHKLHAQSPETVQNITVVCKPDKPTGRGLKILRAPKIKAAAHDLELPLHQIDTFTGWTPSEAYNLVIAVSFGLLVPPRILGAAKYGGLNVHPSLLPDLRGPAPIQWALIYGDKYSGVTLQTLHERHFDKGALIAQSPEPGIPVPDASSSKYDSLAQWGHDQCHRRPLERLYRSLANVGADMLVDAMMTGKFLEPDPKLSAKKMKLIEEGNKELRHAPKITPADRRLDLQNWSAAEALRRDRVIGPLWEMGEVLQSKASSGLRFAGKRRAKRCTFYDWRDVTNDRERLEQPEVNVQAPPGTIALLHTGVDGFRLYCSTSDGRLVSPAEIVTDGEKRVSIHDWAVKLLVESNEADRLEHMKKEQANDAVGES